MSGTIQPPKIVVETLNINNFRYTLSNIIPHTSVNYSIVCYNDTCCVKVIQGLLEGEQYKEWINDDWLDRFMKEKVEALPGAEVKPEQIEPVLESVVEV